MMTDPLWHRLATAVTAYIRYIGKTIWPSNLACLYPNQVGMWSTWQVSRQHRRVGDDHDDGDRLAATRVPAGRLVLVPRGRWCP